MKKYILTLVLSFLLPLTVFASCIERQVDEALSANFLWLGFLPTEMQPLLEKNYAYCQAGRAGFYIVRGDTYPEHYCNVYAAAHDKVLIVDDGKGGFACMLEPGYLTSCL